MTQLHGIWSDFSRRLGHLGAVVIAGGSVRDSLLSRQPKDYDVFVLGSGDGDGLDFSTPLSDLPVIDGLEWHKSEPFLQGTFKYGVGVAQVMATPHKTASDLVDSFDWNVSRFAYDGVSTIAMCDAVSDIAPGRPLRLHKVTFPASTLRRGYRFSERFQMVLDPADVVTLCRAVIAAADAKAVPA